MFLAAVGALYAFTQAAPPPVVREGRPAPEFRLPKLGGGGTTALSELRGRVVFVNFWATWCPPCRDEAPSLEALYRDLQGEGFEVLAISIDVEGADAEIEEFRREVSPSLPVLLDAAKRAYQAYGGTGVPETFLIDPQGRLRERFIGPRDWTEPRYAAAIRRMLGSAGGGPAGG